MVPLNSEEVHFGVGMWGLCRRCWATGHLSTVHIYTRLTPVDLKEAHRKAHPRGKPA